MRARRVGTQFDVAFTARNERRPAVSSFANLLGAGGAAVVWEDDFGTDNDVSLRVYALNGTAIVIWTTASGMPAP